VGLRSKGEKPAAVLWVVYTLGWLPALAAAYALRSRFGPVAVVTAAGRPGALAALGLTASLAILTAAYLAGLRRPPSVRVLLLAAGGSVLAALLMPVLFSADAYAYAFYGDLALRGGNPYAHGSAPHDALAAAAVAAWDGRVPPRCVYGPVAVAIATLADLAGRPGGAGLQILAQRLAAVAAYAFYAGYVLRLVSNPAARAAFILNPVVIWSVAEGHNDAAMVAFVLAGLTTERGRWLRFALAALVKLPAIAAWPRLRRGRELAGAATLALVGYLPLAVALFRALAEIAAPGAGTAWESPLGLLAATTGRVPAVALGLAALGAVALAVRRLAFAERVPAFALAAWFALPNAYPWYALWIVPLASRNLSSIWSRALLAASLFAPARAFTDAVFPAPDRPNVASLHPAMIALEFLPPLIYLAYRGLRRGGAVALTVVVFVVAWHAPARAGTAAAALIAAAPATPAPGPTLAASPTPAPSPLPAASPTPAPGFTSAPGTAPAAGSVPSSSPLPESTAGAAAPAPSTEASAPAPEPLVPPPTPTRPAPPQPAPTSAPIPSASPSLAAPPSVPTPGAPATTPPPALPAPTAIPFSYIITPTPVPVSNPDGPHILEVLLNDRHIRVGGPLLVRVITSANVVGVEARALGRFIAIPQSSPGLFALAYVMPDGIPFWWLNRSYNIVIAAATADGRQTSVSFPMVLTR
jgi:hypothetical protein